MEDSSANPYIPQESDDIRKKVYQRQSPLGKVVKWSLIATVIVAVLVGIGLFFVIPLTAAVDQAAREKLANILQPPEQVLKRVGVESQLGFKLDYDNRIYSSYAEVGDSTAGTDTSAAVTSGETYENNDLRVARAYNYIRIRPVESVDSARALQPLPPELELFATVTEDELTKAAAVPENKGLSKLSLFVKLDSDKRLAKKVSDDKTVVTIDATKPISTNISGIDYQKVRFTTTNDNHRVSNVKYDDCYYTIQNAQPFSICITNVRPFNVSAASLVEQVFDSITFEQASSSETEESTDDKKSSAIPPLARLVQATKDDNTPAEEDAETTDASSESGESPLITVTPGYYTDAASLNAIAVNQPSVVRIGMLYCADMTLKYESGETATNLTDACVGSLSTGVFVSKDGYIATTGHAIRTQKKAAINGYISFAPDQDAMLDRLQRILDYLLKAKVILQSDADYLKTGASIGDQEALAKVQNIASVIPEKFITPINEEYTYAVQPTEKPIVINRSDTLKPSFAYSDTVIKAKYVESNYDPTKSIQEVFGSATPTVDIGLLKVEDDFPGVVVATSENMKSGDTINTIGYPAYTDSSLTIDKIRNIPVATVSKIDQAYEKEGTRLIQTNTPVLPGNDGAPVFDNNGALVGFAVYGLSYCPDQLCFGTGTVRSISELTKLLGDHNLKLSGGSEAFVSWKNGITEFFRSNYAASATAFATARGQYEFNRWGEPLEKLAVAGQDTARDTSFMNQLLFIMITVLIVLAVLTVLLSIVFFLHRRRINMMQVGHYGAAAPVKESPPLPHVLPPTPPVQLPPATPMMEAPIITASVPTPPPANASPIFSVHEPPAAPQPMAQPTPPPAAPQQPAVTVEPPKPLSGPLPPSEDPFYK